MGTRPDRSRPAGAATTGTMSDELVPPALNLWAVAGLAVSVLVAIVGMFVLPSLMDLGLPFSAAFGVVAVAEMGAAFGVVASTLNLYEEDPLQ